MPFHKFRKETFSLLHKFKIRINNKNHFINSKYLYVIHNVEKESHFYWIYCHKDRTRTGSLLQKIQNHDKLLKSFYQLNTFMRFIMPRKTATSIERLSTTIALKRFLFYTKLQSELTIIIILSTKNTLVYFKMIRKSLF
jgi:hypothetical protein